MNRTKEKKPLWRTLVQFIGSIVFVENFFVFVLQVNHQHFMNATCNALRFHRNKSSYGKSKNRVFRNRMFTCTDATEFGYYGESDTISTGIGDELRQGDRLSCLLFNNASKGTVWSAGIDTNSTIFRRTILILVLTMKWHRYSRDKLCSGSETYTWLWAEARRIGLMMNISKTT